MKTFNIKGGADKKWNGPFLTAPKLPEVFCDRNVRPCEPVSVSCPSEPEKLHCLNCKSTHQTQHGAAEVSRR